MCRDTHRWSRLNCCIRWKYSTSVLLHFTHIVSKSRRRRCHISDDKHPEFIPQVSLRLVFPRLQKLRDAGVEVPEPGKKGAGPQEENKILKGEVKTLKEELDTTKKGEEEEEEEVLKSLFLFNHEAHLCS